MSKLFDFINPKPPEDKAGTKQKKKLPVQYLAVVLLLGIALMFVGDLFSGTGSSSGGTVTTADESTNTTPTLDEYKDRYEKDLTAALNEMAGVSNVQVAITLESGEVNVYEKNKTTTTKTTEEEDTGGGKRNMDEQSETEEVVIINESGKEVPVIVQTNTPQVKGVLVVAGGVDDLKVKEKVIEAVTRLLAVERHKVSVQARE